MITKSHNSSVKNLVSGLKYIKGSGFITRSKVNPLTLFLISYIQAGFNPAENFRLNSPQDL